MAMKVATYSVFSTPHTIVTISRTDFGETFPVRLRQHRQFTQAELRLRGQSEGDN
ncbi:hypothetical protein [Nonomuraea jabiensis]|uniref:Uncharacterized protein n=1 Tax=Nonomuraea jabiensis TaxID=882448 RepID=A0A7W9GC65_9ACTN|nr:hypothetical protein [Nonomuraea jabiensis]MBB5781085.1 hypothetical protein [Nonomuraea jabiensis]